MKKKILVLLDAELSRFGIIKSIHDKLDAEYFALIDITENPKKFFDEQKFVNFKKKWFLNEYININENPDILYLQQFEKKYELDLWKLTLNERIFYRFNEFYKFNKNEILSILEHECRLFEEILTTVKPTHALLQLTFFHHYEIFYQLCRKLNVQTLFLRSNRINSKSIITEHYEFLEKKISDIIINQNDDLKIKNITEQRRTKAFERGEKISREMLRSKKKLIKGAIQYLLFGGNNKNNYRYFGRTKNKVLLNFIIGIFKTKFRKNFINNNFNITIDKNDKFVFFPLHIEQEHSLLTIAPFFTDQINCIENIAKSIPIDYVLYVKEHPLMHLRNWRSVREYKKIMELPNVKIFHPELNSNEFIKNCKCVITISGTVALEAGKYEKPSIIFADTMFSELPFITRINNYEDLSSTIKFILEKNYDFSTINKFYEYLENNSHDFDCMSMSLKSEDFFHHGGFYVDTKIDERMMNEFLELHKLQFDEIASKFIEKIR